MEQSFKQFRYFGKNSSYNNVTENALVNGTFITDGASITQLGVRALPGTRFYLNGGTNPVIVGFTGLFEIEFTEGGSISSIRFDQESIAAINTNLSGGYVIIDILSKGGS